MNLSTTAIALLACVGFLAGFVDAVAGGGGLLTVPALLSAGLPAQLALGTNKGQSTFGAIASAASFWLKNGLDRDRAPIGFGFGLVGALIGAALVLRMRPEPLKPVVLGLLVVAAIVVAARPSNMQVKARHLGHPHVALAAIALVLGAYDGFFGPGVGSMLIIAFVTVFGDTMTRASGNAKVVNLASNLAAFGMFAREGTIVWRVALPMAAANALGASVGARVAMKHGDRFVRVMVLVVVCAIVLKLAHDLW